MPDPSAPEAVAFPEGSNGRSRAIEELDRKLWLAQRRALIGASEAAMVLGVSPYGAPVDVYLDKRGLAEEKPETPEMRRGNRRERLVLDAYADAEEIQLLIPARFTLMTNPRFPHLGATLDARRADDLRPVDAKTARWPGKEWGPHDTDVFPLHYAVQLYVQMIVTETDVADLPVEFYGEEYRRYRLHRDPSTSETIVQMLGDFWEQYITKGVAPPIDGSESYRRYLARQFAHATEAVIPSTPEIDRTATTLAFLRAQLKSIETQKVEAENVIKAAIGEARKIEGPNWQATWSIAKPGVKVDWEAVARDLHLDALAHGSKTPLDDVITARSTPTSGSRTFRFTSEEESP